MLNNRIKTFQILKVFIPQPMINSGNSSYLLLNNKIIQKTEMIQNFSAFFNTNMFYLSIIIICFIIATGIRPLFNMPDLEKTINIFFIAFTGWLIMDPHKYIYKLLYILNTQEINDFFAGKEMMYLLLRLILFQTIVGLYFTYVGINTYKGKEIDQKKLLFFSILSFLSMYFIYFKPKLVFKILPFHLIYDFNFTYFMIYFFICVVVMIKKEKIVKFYRNIFDKPDKKK